MIDMSMLVDLQLRDKYYSVHMEMVRMDFVVFQLKKLNSFSIIVTY